MNESGATCESPNPVTKKRAPMNLSLHLKVVSLPVSHVPLHVAGTGPRPVVLAKLGCCGVMPVSMTPTTTPCPAFSTGLVHRPVVSPRYAAVSPMNGLVAPSRRVLACADVVVGFIRTSGNTGATCGESRRAAACAWWARAPQPQYAEPLE